MGESGRSEDDIIAWTWKHFLENPDQPEWLLRMPMTKAARLVREYEEIIQKITFKSLSYSIYPRKLLILLMPFLKKIVLEWV